MESQAMKKIWADAHRDRLVERALERLTADLKHRPVIPGRPFFAVDAIAVEVVMDENCPVAQAKTIEGWVRAAAKRGRLEARQFGRQVAYRACK